MVILLAAAVGAIVAVVLVLACWPDAWLRAQPRGDLARADFFAVFALGLGRDGAGRTNEALADWLLAHNPERKPAIVQEGVYRALLAREPARALAAWVIRLPHDPHVYVTTAAAALQCWAIAAVRGLSRPVVVAHALHLQRVAWLFDPLYTSERVVVPEMPTMPFDPDSVQHWGTRSRRGWVVWELLVARPALRRSRGALLVVLAMLIGAALLGGLAWLL